MAAGSVTVTDQNFTDKASRPIRKISIAWTSDASGDVNGYPTSAFLSGQVVRVVFAPSAGGTQPSNLYDVTLLDGSGLDVLAGQGVNLSNSAASAVVPGVPLRDGTTTSVHPCHIDDQLELRVSGAGNAKTGTVVLYVR